MEVLDDPAGKTYVKKKLKIKPHTENVNINDFLENNNNSFQTTCFNHTMIFFQVY